MRATKHGATSIRWFDYSAVTASVIHACPDYAIEELLGPLTSSSIFRWLIEWKMCPAANHADRSLPAEDIGGRMSGKELAESAVICSGQNKRQHGEPS